MKKFCAYISNQKEFEKAAELGVEEVIVAPNLISRYGLGNFDFLSELTQNAVKISLDFNSLVLQKDFSKLIEIFNKTTRKMPLSSVRAQDPGIIEYLYSQTNFPIVLNLETGHHNWQSIESWVDYLGDRIEKVVLSPELPKEKLFLYAKKLQEKGVRSEILFIGPLLLFYSPRELVSAAFGEKRPYWVIDGKSEESPHKGFRIVENETGTYMYHLKNLCLVERYREIVQSSISELRVDFTDCSEFFITKDLLDGDFESFFQNYPKETTRGYFDVNKTQVLFPKLINQNVLRVDEKFVGEVVSVKKGAFVAFKVESLKGLSRNQNLLIRNPEGKEIPVSMTTLSSVTGNEVEHIEHGQLALIPYLKKVTPKSGVYYQLP
ncbi:MAG: U32 family peptidase [Halobacteriovoraceae bacterium]|nr:U32 family peptidase [Halobacteriovoraceae bacterium]MCB9093596.1 U32 family peptidase [Halobacteriovoraceae bacterium]